MDEILADRWRDGRNPFDGHVVISRELTAEQQQSSLQAVVALLKYEFGGAKLRTMDDWHEHDGVLLPSKEATWDQLLDAVSDPARLIEHTARDTYVRTGWYPTEFEFFLRWWMALDDWKIREVEYPIGTFDVSGSPDLIEELSKLVPLGEVRTAKEYFDETYHGP